MFRFWDTKRALLFPYFSSVENSAFSCCLEICYCFSALASGYPSRNMKRVGSNHDILYSTFILNTRHLSLLDLYNLPYEICEYHVLFNVKHHSSFWYWILNPRAICCWLWLFFVFSNIKLFLEVPRFKISSIFPDKPSLFSTHNGKLIFIEVVKL